MHTSTITHVITSSTSATHPVTLALDAAAIAADQRGKPAGIRGRDHPLDRQVRTVDAEFEIAQRCRITGQDMHVHTQRVTDHAQRIADAALAVKRVARRQRMNDVALGGHGLAGSGQQNLPDVGAFGFMPTKVDGGRRCFALQPAGRHVDDQRIDRQAGHALSCINRVADHFFSRIKIGNDAGLHAFGAVMANADDADVVGTAAQQIALFARRKLADDAADLGGADVQHGDDAGAAGSRRAGGG